MRRVNLCVCRAHDKAAHHKYVHDRRISPMMQRDRPTTGWRAQLAYLGLVNGVGTELGHFVLCPGCREVQQQEFLSFARAFGCAFWCRV